MPLSNLNTRILQLYAALDLINNLGQRKDMDHYTSVNPEMLYILAYSFMKFLVHFDGSTPVSMCIDVTYPVSCYIDQPGMR